MLVNDDPQNCHFDNFEGCQITNLISRKNLVTKKFCNFHTATLETLDFFSILDEAR